MGMANSNAPAGIRPIQDNGTPFNGQGRLVYFPSSQAGNIFLGDPLIYLGGSDAFGVPAVGIAAAAGGTYISGAFNGIMNGPQGSGFTVTRDLPVYRQASIANYGFMIDDPNQLFVAQEDSVGGAMAAASAAMDNVDLIAGAGSTVTGFSGWMLDSSTVNTTPTLQMRVIGLLRGPDNAIGNYAKWVCRMNLASLWNTTGI